MSTPYQGENRCFGYFKCDQCNRRWTSANSWANYGQQCAQCKINVMPHKQRPLRKPKVTYNNDPKKRHPMELCQKCIELGTCCKEAYSEKKKKRRRRRRN